MVYGKEKYFVLGRLEQPRQDKYLLYQHGTNQGRTPFLVLFESPFVSISTVNRARGHPSLVSLGAIFFAVNYSNLLETSRNPTTTSYVKHKEDLSCTHLRPFLVSYVLTLYIFLSYMYSFMYTVVYVLLIHTYGTNIILLAYA
jgi:hypothetical protein